MNTKRAFSLIGFDVLTGAFAVALALVAATRGDDLLIVSSVGLLAIWGLTIKRSTGSLLYCAA